MFLHGLFLANIVPCVVNRSRRRSVAACRRQGAPWWCAAWAACCLLGRSV